MIVLRVALSLVCAAASLATARADHIPDLECDGHGTKQSYEDKFPGCQGPECPKFEISVKCWNDGVGFISVSPDAVEPFGLAFSYSSDDGDLDGSVDPGHSSCGSIFLWDGSDCTDVKYESKCEGEFGAFELEVKFIAPPTCCVGWCRRRLLDGEEVPVKEDYTPEEVSKTIRGMKRFGASPDATFSFKYDLISNKSCAALVDYVDANLARDLASGEALPVGTASVDGSEEKYESWTSFAEGGVDNQYSKKVYADDLVQMIGREDTLKIIDYFEESLGGLTIDCMYLARHAEPKQDLYVVPWHTDTYATVEITLNDDYEGGHVLHMNADGVHKTEARVGSATAHNADIVHGITTNTGGSKYMLILKHHFDRPDKVGVVRLSREMVDEITGKVIG